MNPDYEEYIYGQCSEALDKYLKDMNASIQECVDSIRMALSEEYDVVFHTQPDGVAEKNQPAQGKCQCGQAVFMFWRDLPKLTFCPFCTEPYYAIKAEDIEVDVEPELDATGEGLGAAS
ncbi:MAG: hypothetical protein ACYS7Y_34555 [Planctomycetota bacterium]|jgi:hypothetical protein